MSKRKRPRKYKRLVKDIKGKVPTTKRTVEYSLGKTKRETQDVVLRDYSIAWGFPCDELMFSKFFINAVRVLNIMPWDAIITSESTYLPEARNVIHTAFVNASQNHKYLAMMDSDVLAPPWWLETLISHKKPLVGGWYKHKIPENGKYNPVVYDYKKTEEDDKGWDVNYYQRRKYPSEGLERVDALGAGCLLMRRDLAEALGERPYDMNSGGEDMVMCKKVYDLGFDIHVDWSLACAHIGVSYV